MFVQRCSMMLNCVRTSTILTSICGPSKETGSSCFSPIKKENCKTDFTKVNFIKTYKIFVQSISVVRVILNLG